MTETTANIEINEGIQRGQFALALVLAPLTTGVPSAIFIALASTAGDVLVALILIAVFPVVATVLGAPTYLLFGGFAFERALRDGTSVPLAGFKANLLSLPIVLGVCALLDGLEGMIFALVFYGGLGSVFAPLWGAIFVKLYKRFTHD